MRVFVATTLIMACGGGGLPPRTGEVTAAPFPTKTPKPMLSMESELGSIDEAGVRKTFVALHTAFEGCQKRGLARVEVLSGDVQFFVRVGRDGKGKYAYFLESDVGDRDTEKCMLDAVLAASFPTPEGGEAEVRYKTGLPDQSARPATAWSAAKVEGALQKADAFAKCPKSQGVIVTLYVGDAGGKEGKVLAAGVAGKDKLSPEEADCVAKAAKELRVPTPGSWPAKVTFGL